MKIPKEYKILGGIALAAIILGYLLFRFGSSSPKATSPFSQRADAYALGDAQAKVTLTEFSDFQCPACRVAQTTVKKITGEYQGKVKLVFRHFPLDIHPSAKLAAEAAEAAGKQGKFWQMHDLLYDRQSDWGDLTKNLTEGSIREVFKNYAKELGLDMTKFTDDISKSAYDSIIMKDYNDGISFGVNATPTFFVNDKVIKSPSYNDIKQGIEEALK
ncbi:MAG: thioredoxin domain-containing protein [Candidatus Falkowbacteria bacterium]|nr:thioredoxin domain-containing protein [Candidatus Falkowbacteria bacterium]